jgi:hypothetical protein
MGFWSEAFKNIDRPSNALQGLAVGGVEGLKRGWGQEENYDFEQLWDADLQKKGWSEREGFGEKGSYVASTIANILVDPLNLLPIGLLTKGTKAVNKAKQMGANIDKSAMKGSFISSFPNYIQGRYGRTARTKEVMKSLDEGLLSGVSVKGITPAKGYGAFKKGTGFAKTGVAGVRNIIKNSLSPDARALYRSHNINKGLMESAYLSTKKNKDIELIHRALANAHIAEASGTVGSKTLLRNFIDRVGFQGYTPFKMGSYHQASKGKVRGGSSISKDESNMLEGIMGRVWENRKGISASDDPSTMVFMKRVGSQKGGNHIDDMKKLSPDIGKIRGAFTENSKEIQKMNLDELAEFLNKLTGKTFIPDKKTGQVWSNFSMTGTSITEGGVNIAFGIKKNGRFVASVSDEHNFLEKLPVIGKMIESSLPKRVIMMTTPVTGKIKDFVAKVTAKEGAIYSGKGSRITQYEKNRLAIMNKLNKDAWKKELATITDAKATRPDLIHEVGRQYQGLGAVGMSKEIGTGMFSEQYSQ